MLGGCALLSPQAIFAKGANMIPMDELEGRMSASAHRQLVRSAADGGMNTLRVWGGGIFLPRAWYVRPLTPFVAQWETKQRLCAQAHKVKERV